VYFKLQQDKGDNVGCTNYCSHVYFF
jgi:hypothetical protein